MKVRAAEVGMDEIARMLATRRDLPPLLVLRFPGLNVLHKRLSFAMAAESGLDTLLGFEMDRETPYDLDEVYWSYRVRRRDVAHGRVDVDLAFVPKLAIATTLDTARRAGLDPAGVETNPAPGETMLVRFSAPTFAQRLQSRRSVAVLAGAACLLTLLAGAVPFLLQYRALAAAEARIGELSAPAEQAAALRKSIDRLSDRATFLDTERKRTGDALSTLAALTRILPDDTYLTALSLHDGKLTILGMAPAAANLISVLANVPRFQQPAFASPLRRSEGGSVETFTITAILAAGAS